MSDFLNELATRYAKATGHLHGTLISMALYDDITPRQFKFIYEALTRSYELSGQSTNDFDFKRLEKRAAEIGAVI